MSERSPNIDSKTVAGFGDEWDSFDQTSLSGDEFRELFERYFHIFPFEEVRQREGFDLGCGSGRWAAAVAPKVGKLHCIDPSAKALAVAKRSLAGQRNVEFHQASVDAIPLADASQDFGYSLGVLHHIPDTAAGIRDCASKLKPGAPFLVYLYYALDNRPAWFRAVWRASNLARRTISAMPFRIRKTVTELLAATVYWPLARGAGLAERLGADVSNWPLSSYRSTSFYSMRTDSLDRFGTRLEHRFTRDQILRMMQQAGLERVSFSDREPFWCAVGYRAR